MTFKFTHTIKPNLHLQAVHWCGDTGLFASCNPLIHTRTGFRANLEPVLNGQNPSPSSHKHSKNQVPNQAGRAASTAAIGMKHKRRDVKTSLNCAASHGLLFCKRCFESCLIPGFSPHQPLRLPIPSVFRNICLISEYFPRIFGQNTAPT